MAQQLSVKDISKKIEELPTPDFIVNQIINIASNPNSNTKDLSTAILESPTLAAKILKLANSAYYAMPKRITKLSQAINILGFRTVRNLAMSIFTASSYFNKEYEYFNTKKLWKHFMASGIAAELLARYLNFPEKEEAFLCGMLHDIGKIAMANIMPEIFEMVLKIANHKKISFLAAEELLETYSHQQIGRMLFENWKMSELLIDSVTYHDTPELIKNENTKMLVYLVNIANSTVNLIFYGYSGSYNISIPNETIWNSLGLTPKKYMNYYETLKTKIGESEDFLNLKNIVEEIEED